MPATARPLYSATLSVKYIAKPPAAAQWSMLEDQYSGRIFLAATPEGEICCVAFAGNHTEEDILAEWQMKWPATKFVPMTQAQRVPLKNLFAGKSQPMQLKLLMVGTAFQHSVWQILLKIPAGEVLSYGEVARRIGSPKAARAVGTACGANPIPLLVPCHRVVASDGSLGGFGGGLKIKQKLLDAESMNLRLAA